MTSTSLVSPAASECRPGPRTLGRAFRLLAVAALSLALTACGLTAPRSSAGFADLDSLGLQDTDRVMTLSIGPALLRFAASHVDDDPDTQALLRSLDGVRLRIYEIDGDAERVGGRIERMAGRLAGDGWEPVLAVRQGREQTHMLMRTDGERIAGMTVLVSDGEEEAVVINLMGDIRPEQFGGVMAALAVDAAGADEIAPRRERES